MSEQRPLTYRRAIIVLDPAHVIFEQTGQTIIVRNADGLDLGTVYPTRH
jgi:hypothetical protein